MQETLSAKNTDKQQLLLEAAIDLFAQQGFWNSSTASIAKHAKVATGTLFNYFASKDALIDAVYVTLKKELWQAIIETLPEASNHEGKNNGKALAEHVWFKYIHWSLDFPVRHDLLNQLRLSDLVSEQAQDSMSEAFQPAQMMFASILDDENMKTLETGYFLEIFMAQMQANAEFAKQQDFSEMALAKHITLGFEVFWDGISR